MTVRESSVMREVAFALSHFGLYVVPANARPGDVHWSVWRDVDPERYTGVVWRCNTGAANYSGKRFVRFGIPGVSDYLGFLIPSGRICALEVKSESGSLTHDQRAFGALLGQTGGLWGMARSYQDAEKVLTGWGLTRR